VKGTQSCSKEGDSPLPRGVNSEKVKIHCKFLNIFFSRTSWPKLIKLSTNHPSMKGTQTCSNKQPDPLQREDNHKKT
jgi:hypothetical protein